MLRDKCERKRVAKTRLRVRQSMRLLGIVSRILVQQQTDLAISVHFRRNVLSLRQIDELRPKSAGFARFNDKSLYRVLVQLGKILRLRHGCHVIQGKLEAELLEFLQRSLAAFIEYHRLT